MLDFYTIAEDNTKKDSYEVYPNFQVMGHPKDLMIKGKDFYAVWIEEKGLWSTDEDDVIKIVDRDVSERVKEVKDAHPQYKIKGKTMRSSRSGVIDVWHKYCQRQMRDSYKELDSKIIFRNTQTTRKDYASKKLPYDLVDGECPAWDEIIGTLYSDEERQKIEWSIGSIFSGDSKKIQKFIVFYGDGGTGKSTIMNIIEKLFEGYWSRFNAKEIASNNNAFALESFKNNPLVSIQHDGDLSRIEDNTMLNSIVSHESMEINEKFKSRYIMPFNTFLFMGTNKPVKITEAKSGIIRRLIDVRPTGKKIPRARYDDLMEKVDFELGQIASHCLKVYKKLGKSYYDDYIPKDMIASTNEFYNFMEENYDMFLRDDGIPAKKAYSLYKQYCIDTNMSYQLNYTRFRTEFISYFEGVKDRCKVDGVEYYNYYYGFKWDKFPGHEGPSKDESTESDESAESAEDGPYGIRKDADDCWIIFKDSSEYAEGSLFDRGYEGQPAQYAKDDGSPKTYWSRVTTKLMDLDTHELHYVLLPENHIVIDFDIKNADGDKDYDLNLAAASKFPKTYAELSKSGSGIHLHYIYDGDTSKLSHIFDDNIEIKTFSGKASLRRKLTKCNDLEIAHLNSGLPLKGVKNTVVNFDAVNLEKSLKTTIKKCIAKEVHPDTTSNVDFIKKILDDAYASGKPYDVSDLQQRVIIFANNSTNQSAKCLKTVGQMKWKSEESSEDRGLVNGAHENENYISNVKEAIDDKPIVFFDIEIFPNLFVVCWKIHHKDGVVKMINPSSKELDPLMQMKLVGFNNRRYDNHILYARWARNYSNYQLYQLSRRIIEEKDREVQFGEAFNISYSDVWEFATNKQGLKKWEIELGINHLENEHPWDQPVDEKYWGEIADYCANDVIATEVVFDHCSADFKTRELLSELSGLSVNDPNRKHLEKILIGNDKEADHVYTDLATGRQYKKGEKNE